MIPSTDESAWRFYYKKTLPFTAFIVIRMWTILLNAAAAYECVRVSCERSSPYVRTIHKTWTWVITIIGWESCLEEPSSYYCSGTWRERERGEEGGFLTTPQKKMYGKLFTGVGRSSEKKQLGWWVWTQSWQHWTNFWWGRMSGLQNTPHNSPLTITSCGGNCSSSSIRWLPYLVAISINSQQIRYCNSIQLTPWRTKSSSVDHEANQPLSYRVGPQSWGSIPVSQYH